MWVQCALVDMALFRVFSGYNFCLSMELVLYG
jgi:hypothetical protein